MTKCSTVLVVDYDETIRETLSVVLKKEGFLVDMAATGKEAIEKSDKKLCDHAILNIELPDMKGTEPLDALSQVEPKMIRIIHAAEGKTIGPLSPLLICVSLFSIFMFLMK